MKKKTTKVMAKRKFIGGWAILGIIFFSFTACNDDVGNVGSSLVNDDNFEAAAYDETALEAHSEKINRVQSNNMSSYALGYYDDAEYGKTKANVLTQLKMSQTDPNFGGEDAELDSVVLSIPYFNTEDRKDFESSDYELDSIFGEGGIKLSVYRSDYFLRDEDPHQGYASQAYYSDQGDKFEQNMDNDPIFTTDFITPSADRIEIHEPIGHGEEADTTELTPQLRVKLPTAYFQENIVDHEGENELLSNENFKDFFRGLYLKTEQTEDGGFFGLLDFNSDEAGIKLYYHNETEDSDGDTEKNYGTFKLGFGDQIVNVFDTDYDELPDTDGDLYLKGGQGSMGVINLFTDARQLDTLREKDWLINEANLKFYVDEDKLPEDQDEPQRIFIYDIKNEDVLLDYNISGDENENDILASRKLHLGGLEEDEDGRYYKIRLTNYVDNIINNDSTNTKLGIVVSQNVNESDQAKVEVGDNGVSTVPVSEVLARNGTIFHGTEDASDKALKLQVYFTEPDEPMERDSVN